MTGAITASLGLRAGDLVEVRSREEIFSTLDADGSLESLPFMPEMLRHCGKRYTVFKRADKTCDTIERTGIRRMMRAVHLDGVRCDGEDHGGCQATCLIYWKEAWLKRVPEQEAEAAPRRTLEPGTVPSPGSDDADRMEETIRRRTCSSHGAPGSGEERYSCQITELKTATSPMTWWDPRQYVRDILSGNVCLKDFFRGSLIAAFNTVQRKRHGRGYPFLDEGLLLPSKTPSARIGLQAGEFVRIRSKEKILRTLDTNYKNRGLFFDTEMVRYCGRTARVLKRVEKIIDERTGTMIHLSNDCIILEGVVCIGDLSSRRMFCPRSIHPFWREIWLERVQR